MTENIDNSSENFSGKFFKVYLKYVLSIIPLIISIYLFTFIPGISNGETYRFEHVWFPELGINLTFYIDGLSLLFGLMISVIGFFIIIYGGEYLSGDHNVRKFYFFTLAFMGSMLGLVFSSNLVCLFIFWELTSVTSFFLIGYKNQYEKARDAALQALIVTGLGGLALLAGVILLSKITGSIELTELLISKDIFANSVYGFPVMILFLLAAFTKSAQFPFHFWLPNAMEAPTPVSAYLHSATMVKAGVYLVARMDVVFINIAHWNTILMTFGGFTMLLGAILSFGKDDLKQILAYTTVSSLGLLIFLIGVGNEYALKAFAVFIVVHSLYKGTLFLVAGDIEYSTGTRYISKLSGLAKKMPVTFYAALFAALSSAGLIPFIGFVAKEYMYESAIKSELHQNILLGSLMLANVIIVAAGFLAGIKPFVGKQSEETENAHEVKFGMLFGPVVMAACCLLFGFFLPVLSDNILLAAVLSINPGIEVHPYKLWSGFNVVFVLSLLTIAAGTLLYFARNLWTAVIPVFKFTTMINPERIYNFSMDSLLKFATLQTKILQNGYIRFYLITIFLTAIGLIGAVLIKEIHLVREAIFDNIYVYEVFMSLLVVISAMVCIRAKKLLFTVVTLGVIGFAVAGIFIIYGAPDLAMTQFSIETLTVILFVLVLYKLPEYLPITSKFDRLRDLSISVVFGLMIALVVIVLTERDLSSPLSDYYSMYSYILAKGKNVVNVILVDFRSLDTLGEVTVLVVAGLGVYALLRLNIKDRGS